MTPSRPAVPPPTRLLLAGAALLLATACTGGPPGGGGDGATPAAAPAVSSTPKITTAADRSLPIDPYLLSYEQRDQLERAHAVLLSRCMARFGIDYRAQPQIPSGNRPRSRTDRRYLESDAATAQAYGYHAEEGDRPVPPPAQPQLSGAANMVLSGTADAGGKTGPGGQDYNGSKVPNGGCIGEAKEKLGADASNSGGGDAQLARDIDASARGRSKTDDRVTGTFRAWSDCMKGRGFDYPDPIKVLDDPRWASAAPTDVERNTAVADVACKEQANVVGVWFSVEAAYESQLIEQNAPALARIRKDNEDRLRAAAQALAS
ncbi:hypothetical protein [Kitasatospora sp. NBC_00458]|uniref:hypothetical protein n=1 Tax=Kitasatospora sp. NBC_00458 TaxID=2903568 RepID=UPI002E18B488